MLQRQLLSPFQGRKKKTPILKTEAGTCVSPEKSGALKTEAGGFSESLLTIRLHGITSMRTSSGRMQRRRTKFLDFRRRCVGRVCGGYHQGWKWGRVDSTKLFPAPRGITTTGPNDYIYVYMHEPTM